MILNVIASLPPSCWASPLPLGMEYFVFGGMQHSPVDGCSAASCNFVFLQEKMSSRPFTLPSCLTPKGFSIVNEIKVDAFLEFTFFL